MPTQTQQDTAILVTNRGDRDVALATSLLEKVGLQVLSGSRREALGLIQAAEQSDQPVQLVVIDDTAGSDAEIRELMDGLSAFDPRLRMLLLSGQDRIETATVPERNVRCLVKKPFRRAAFLGSVLKALREPMVRTA